MYAAMLSSQLIVTVADRVPEIRCWTRLAASQPFPDFQGHGKKNARGTRLIKKIGRTFTTHDKAMCRDGRKNFRAAELCRRLLSAGKQGPPRLAKAARSRAAAEGGNRHGHGRCARPILIDTHDANRSPWVSSVETAMAEYILFMHNDIAC